MKIHPDLQGKKIAVLCGGRSREAEISRRSGKRVAEALRRLGFDVISVDPAADFIDQLKKERIDIVYNILHGTFGEDGTVQAILEFHGFPTTGSKMLASALSMNKVAAKRMFLSVHVPTAPFVVIDKTKDAWEQGQKIQAILGVPVVIKPISEGSSFGVTLVRNPSDLPHIIEETRSQFGPAFAESLLEGQEVTVGIIGVGERVKALPVLELVSKNAFYDYEAKYTPGKTEFILPARLSESLTRNVQEVALAAHRALGCEGVSRVDLIVGKNGELGVLEVNTTPRMTEQSDLPAAAAHAGTDFETLVLLILESALPSTKTHAASTIR